MTEETYYMVMKPGEWSWLSCAYVRYDLKLHVNCIELENGARLSQQGDSMKCFHKTCGGGWVSYIGRLEAWDLGR